MVLSSIQPCMSDLLQLLLGTVLAERAAQKRPMQPPATGEQLQKFLARSQELDYQFPATYLEVLSVADGIDSNGIVLYASETQPLVGHADRPDYTIEGIVDANLTWRDYKPNQRFVFFAEAGDMVYCHDLTKNTFQIMDRIAQDVDSESDVFTTCEELMEKVLNHMLNRYGSDEDGES